MIGRAPPVLLVLGFLMGAAGPAAAEWPYLTEEAANLSTGVYSVSLGVGRTDREKEARFAGQELLTPPAGVYWAIPEVQGTLGVGPRAEVSFDYQYLLHHPDAGGESRFDTGDLRLWTKLGLLRRGDHALAVRFGVKLPNSTNLGTNETDFFLAGLYDFDWGGWVAAINLGLGVVGNPGLNRSQDDLFTWGSALRWRGNGDGVRAGVEVVGANGPYGVERQRDGRLYAGVFGWQWGRWRVDGTLRYGRHDWAGWGGLAGVTYER